MLRLARTFRPRATSPPAAAAPAPASPRLRQRALPCPSLPALRTPAAAQQGRGTLPADPRGTELRRRASSRTAGRGLRRGSSRSRRSCPSRRCRRCRRRCISARRCRRRRCSSARRCRRGRRPAVGSGGTPPARPHIQAGRCQQRVVAGSRSPPPFGPPQQPPQSASSAHAPAPHLLLHRHSRTACRPRPRCRQSVPSRSVSARLPAAASPSPASAAPPSPACRQGPSNAGGLAPMRSALGPPPAEAAAAAAAAVEARRCHQIGAGRALEWGRMLPGKRFRDFRGGRSSPTPRPRQ